MELNDCWIGVGLFWIGLFWIVEIEFVVFLCVFGEFVV